MKIFIDSNLKNPGSGKGFFCKRLSDVFKTKNIKMVGANDKPDIALHVIKIKNPSNASKRILRLDGVCHDIKLNYKSKNKPIMQNMNKCDGVVYQSEWAKGMCDRYLGRFKGQTQVAINGHNLSFYNNIDPIKSDFQYCFFTASRWRPHKRLIESIESFLTADIPDSCLYVAGDLSASGISKQVLKKYWSNKVIYVGNLNQQQMGSYFKACQGYIHLCMTDSCPNSVVESVVANCCPIVSNEGGAPEIAGPSGGIVANIDKTYNKEPINLYNPPKIDINIVAEHLRFLANNKIELKRDHVDINRIADLYIDLFNRVLS